MAWRRRLGRIVLALSMAAAPQAYAQAAADLAQVMPSVVRVSLVGRDEYGGYYLHSVGSGFVAAPERVVTNSHVIRGALEQDNLFIVVTPHEGFGDKLIVARVIRENTDADLALIEAPELNAPSARIALPPAHTGIVNAVGYPALMCDVLDCTADERIAPSVPDFSSGPITRFADRTPRGGAVKTIFHRAAISGGNSGGPIVDQCGRVVGVNAWTSAAYLRADGSIEAPTAVSIATHSEPLMAFLSDAGLAVHREETRCRTAEEVNLALQQELEALKTSVAAQAAEQVRAGAAEAEAQRNRTQTMMIWGGVALVVLIVGGVGATGWIRSRGAAASGRTGQGASTRGPNRVPYIVAGGAVAAAFGAWMISQGDVDTGTPKDVSLNRGMTPKAVTCVLDGTRSIAHPTASDAMELTFETARACVNGRTPYAMTEAGYDRVIVSTREPKVTLNRFDAGLSVFTQDTYVIGREVWSELRQIADTLPSGCASMPDARRVQDAKLIEIHERLEGRLASQPARRSAWACSVAEGGPVPAAVN